jgi:hypothetical protein
LSHAWFSDDWFDDRWVNEGLAQVYSNMAVQQLGGTPKEPEPIASADPGKVTLNEWGNPNFTDGADEVETYGYNASYSVMQRIHDELGDDKMRDVFAIVDDGIIAYAGADLEEKGDSNADWRRLLDILEITGGSKDARDLFERYVVSAKDLAKLDDRDAARTVYADLSERGGDWAPPLVVRRNMAGWIFDKATTTMGDATEVLDLRDELDDKAAQLDATYPTNFETDYEAVTRSFDDVTDEMQQQIDTADAVIAAAAVEAKDDGFFESIGLWGTTLPNDLELATNAFEQGDHDAARAAAAKVTDTVADAGSVGTKRFLWAVGGLLLFVLLIVLVVTRVDRRQTAGPTRVVECHPVLGDVRDAVLQLHEHVVAVVDAQPVAGAQILVDPHPHGTGRYRHPIERARSCGYPAGRATAHRQAGPPRLGTAHRARHGPVGMAP